MDLSRRAFVKLVGASAACACSGVLGIGGCAGNPTATTPPAPEGSYRFEDGRLRLILSEVGTLLGVGGAVKLTLPDADGPERKVILVRTGEADYRAFANACTHNGKELNYLHAEGLLACCGRSSRFDLSGKVVHGPAEDALPCYTVRQEGKELVIDI
ncbi:MAG: Rieske 2Fe-2S domain-containing protein [Anaerolineae bacterium]|nr:Rieske 2Fe-2S domain-containing protein [Anaerolineae bacterium]